MLNTMKNTKETLENIRKEKLLSLKKEELLEIIYQKDKEIKRLSDIISNTIKTNVELEEELKILKKKDEPSAKKTVYNQKWSWVVKIIFSLRENDCPMKSQEIISFLEKFDNTLPYWPNKAKSFSAHLTKTVGYGRIIQHKLKGIQGYFYFLPEWIDKTGEIKNVYLEKVNLVQ